ncbi:glycerophosphodiester phosphodiesterase [Yinghuangia seranimata]|uniref:glycerophosphodiester phosphodiesterase n=1 Tax=Yinghuangia seranimata TaxID=408067 RepID=UPI00248C4C47|nr:glycerophosphodiester phosphodiesterase family protein [Yinghuangia seranimata]MDI2127757.1 glycerophosphodiester phosphodiesterase family protein [Yinghuangia seranimata]
MVSLVLAAGGASAGLSLHGGSGGDPDTGGPHPRSAPSGCRLPLAAAHRGANSEEPENTVAAFARAIDAGTDDLELDVHWTRDGVPVVIHDDTVERTTGTPGGVNTLTAAQIWALDAGRGRRIPTLDVVLEMAARRDVTVLVELKTTPTAEQVQTFLSVLRRAGAKVIVHSFLPEALDAVHRADPQVPVGLTTGEDITPTDAARWGGHFLNMQHGQIDEQKVRAWQAAGLKVYAWVVDDSATWESLAKVGVDGIVTDKVAEYVAWSRAKCGSR